MRPAIGLDGDALRANVRAFRALGAPVAAVVKSDGYGWGAVRLARELDAVVESYVVADADELAALRPATSKPVRVLADAPPGRLRHVLDLGAIPNVSDGGALAEAVAEAGRRGPFTVRVGILDATGWSAIPARDAGAFAPALAAAGLAVELWTHIASTARAAAILADFAAAERTFAAAGVAVAGRDVASTVFAGRGPACDRLRLGVGLFGARLGAPVETRCALRVVAPVVRRFGAAAASWAGYGDAPVTRDHAVAVLRCGYGDGYPRGLSDGADVLAIGMQYTTRVERAGQDVRVLVDERADIDGLAARAGISPHEFVVGLAPR